MEAACGMTAETQNGAAVTDAGVRPAVSTAPHEATRLNLRICHDPPQDRLFKLQRLTLAAGRRLVCGPRIGASFASRPIARFIQHRTPPDTNDAIGTRPRPAQGYCRSRNPELDTHAARLLCNPDRALL